MGCRLDDSFLLMYCCCVIEFIGLVFGELMDWVEVSGWLYIVCRRGG